MSNDPFFRMKVEDVFFIRGRGTVAVGRIEQGTLSLGDQVDIQRGANTRRVVVAGLEMFHKTLNQAATGDNIGVLLKDVSKDDVQRGDMLMGVGGGDFTWKP
jgi:elongation factor Tu